MQDPNLVVTEYLTSVIDGAQKALDSLKPQPPRLNPVVIAKFISTDDANEELNGNNFGIQILTNEQCHKLNGFKQEVGGETVNTYATYDVGEVQTLPKNLSGDSYFDLPKSTLRSGLPKSTLRSGRERAIVDYDTMSCLVDVMLFRSPRKNRSILRVTYNMDSEGSRFCVDNYKVVLKDFDNYMGIKDA